MKKILALTVLLTAISFTFVSTSQAQHTVSLGETKKNLVDYARSLEDTITAYAQDYFVWGARSKL